MRERPKCQAVIPNPDFPTERMACGAFTDHGPFCPKHTVALVDAPPLPEIREEDVAHYKAGCVYDPDLNCESCGSAIEDETIGSGGFPVLCAYCWLDLPEAERKNRPHERVSAEDRAFHKHMQQFRRKEIPHV